MVRSELRCHHASVVRGRLLAQVFAPRATEHRDRRNSRGLGTCCDCGSAALDDGRRGNKNGGARTSLENFLLKQPNNRKQNREFLPFAVSKQAKRGHFSVKQDKQTGHLGSPNKHKQTNRPDLRVSNKQMHLCSASFFHNSQPPLVGICHGAMALAGARMCAAKSTPAGVKHQDV